MTISRSTSKLLSAILASVFSGLAVALTLYLIFGKGGIGVLVGTMIGVFAFLQLSKNAMVGLSRFLCQCGGANMTILEKCPGEVSKIASIGLTVLLTGIFATISGGYAMFKIFNNLPIALLLGPLWGIMIFNIDRYIVMSMRKTGSFGSDLKIATPRLILAIFISIVVVKPLEIRLFADRLKEKIVDLELSSKEDFKKRREHLSGLDVTAQEMQDFNVRLDSMNRVVIGEPVDDPQYEALKNATNTSLQKKQQKERENSPKIAELRIEINRLEKNPSVYQVDTNGIKKPAGEDARQHYSKIIKLRGLRNEVNSAISVYDIANKNQLNYLKNYRQQAHDLADEIKDRSEETQKKRDSIDMALRPDIEKDDASIDAAFTENFVTQIEALGKLTGQSFSTMWWMSWLIVLLFMVIETSPIFVKMISPSGPYDELLEAENVRLKAKAIYDSNTQMMIDEQRNQLKLQTYMQAQQYKNQEIEHAIKSWTLQKNASLEQSQGSWSDEEYKKYIEEVINFGDELLSSMNGQKKHS